MVTAIKEDHIYIYISVQRDRRKKNYKLSFDFAEIMIFIAAIYALFSGFFNSAIPTPGA